jgi:phosphatidylserine/phosphatidylglycerophosphate/cardiolipin synthase-like enzyme/uncharacterized membrane protein YdjX (TVP38/TMEM64 family)
MSNKKYISPDNCCKQETSENVSFVIDGEAYYRALYEAFCSARRSIFIVGWDLHSELKLIRNDKKHDYPVELGPLLNKITSEKKDLNVYLLCWDFAMIYTLEREFFPRYRFKWKAEKRVNFALDGHHPVGASQHQKMVAIDDVLAFAGGLDLSKWRWDTSLHLPDDPRRVDPYGKPYPPFHDIQMAVSGPAARAISEICRERWQRAGGKKPVDINPSQTDKLWPESLKPDLTDVSVAVSRTLPEYRDQHSVSEVENLYIDSIAAAERYIYIENQYLSSHSVGKAIQESLAKPEGPEIIIVMPEKTGGWLEQHTMDILRGRILSGMRDSDKYNRLRTFYPRIKSNPSVSLMIHAKVMVADDQFLRIGSSNLSNRSMGFDSELDLSIFADDNQKISEAIKRFRNSLIAEHTGREVDEAGDVLENSESLIKGIESLHGGERDLVPFDGGVPENVDRWVPDSKFLDPEKPVEPEELINYVITPHQRSKALSFVINIGLPVTAVLVLAALWKWSPLGEFVDLKYLISAGKWIRGLPYTPVMVYAAFIIAGITVFPITLMIIASIIIFGPLYGGFLALTGSLLSAVFIFAAGRLLGRNTVRSLSGSIFNRLNKKLSDSGLMAVITFRIVPLAPFSFINLIAGVSEIKFRDYFVGTLLGMLPGVIGFGFIVKGLSMSMLESGLTGFAVMFAAVLIVGAGFTGLKKWIRRKNSGIQAEQDD